MVAWYRLSHRRGRSHQEMDRRTLIVGGIVVAIAAFSVAIKLHALRAPSGAGRLQRGQKAPALHLAGLDESTRVIPSASDGGLVVVTFWASWCAPCRIELPGFARAYKVLQPKHVELFAVNMDSDRSAMERFLVGKDFKFPVLRDPGGRAASIWGIGSLPTTVVLDPAGRVLDVREGLIHDLERHVKRFMRRSR